MSALETKLTPTATLPVVTESGSTDAVLHDDERLLAIVYALVDWGAGCHAGPSNAASQLNGAIPSQMIARFGNGQLTPSPGVAPTVLQSPASQQDIPIHFELVSGTTFILSPGKLQQFHIGFYAEPVPNGNAWLIFAAVNPPLFIRLQRKGNVFYAKLGVVELPYRAPSQVFTHGHMDAILRFVR